MRMRAKAGNEIRPLFVTNMAEQLSIDEGDSLYGSVERSPRRLGASRSSSRTRSWQRRWRMDAGRKKSPPGINVVQEDTRDATTGSADDSSRVAITKVRNQPKWPAKLPSCKHMCAQRVPKGRALVLILVMLVIERYILSGAVDQVLNLIPELPKGKGSESFVRIFLYYCVSRLFYPIGGFIADVYLGRCRVIHLSLWLYWIAFALLTVANMLREFSLHHTTVLYTHILPIAAYVLVIFASGGFESTLIPFGADQLEAASSSELSSYFYWYYIAIQVGPLLNIFFNSVFTMWLPTHANLLQVFTTLVVATLGLVLHQTLQHWYFRNALRENCIKLVLNVLWFAARVKRHVPQHRRAFRYGEGKISRINLAKMRYDGKFASDQVEDVKTFCMVCLILVCLGGYFFTQSGVIVMLTYRINATLFELTANSSNVRYIQVLSSNLFIILNSVVGLLFVPLVNHIFIPCIPSLSMRGRMAIGMVINAVAIVTTIGIETGIRSKHTAPLQSFYLLYILPTVLITLPEVLTTMSALEFVYAQSPESMKGMLTGLLYFIFGVFNGGSTTVFYFFIQASSVYAYYYVLLLVFAVIGLVAYVIAACLYVNRQRTTPESEESEERRLLYDNIIHNM